MVAISYGRSHGLLFHRLDGLDMSISIILLILASPALVLHYVSATPRLCFLPWIPGRCSHELVLNHAVPLSHCLCMRLPWGLCSFLIHFCVLPGGHSTAFVLLEFSAFLGHAVRSVLIIHRSCQSWCASRPCSTHFVVLTWPRVTNIDVVMFGLSVGVQL